MRSAEYVLRDLGGNRYLLAQWAAHQRLDDLTLRE